MKRSLPKQFKRQEGIALLIVLMATLALMILVVEFVYSTRVHYTMAQNLRDRLQAEYMAKSAIQMSLLILKFQKKLDSIQTDEVTLFSSAPLYQQIPLDTHLLRLALSGGDLEGVTVTINEEDRKRLDTFLDFSGNFAAQIEDEDGKINLNALSMTVPQSSLSSGNGQAQASQSPSPSPSPKDPKNQEPTVSDITIEQLQSMMDFEEYDYLFPTTQERDEIIYNLQDWIDEDGQRSGFRGGFEDDLYTRYSSPYKAKNAKFSTLDEIGLVAGVSQEFLDAFRPALTIYGGANKVNINTAQATVLRGLMGRLIDSRNEAEIDEIVEWIDGLRNFQNQAEFLEGLNTNFGYETNELDAFTLNTLIFKSSTFTIRAAGTVGGLGDYGQPITANIEMVVAFPSTNEGNNSSGGQNRYSFPGGIQVLYWRVQ